MKITITIEDQPNGVVMNVSADPPPREDVPGTPAGAVASIVVGAGQGILELMTAVSSDRSRRFPNGQRG